MNIDEKKLETGLIRWYNFKMDCLNDRFDILYRTGEGCEEEKRIQMEETAQLYETFKENIKELELIVRGAENE